jgi:hypothetical protein
VGDKEVPHKGGGWETDELKSHLFLPSEATTPMPSPSPSPSSLQLPPDQSSKHLLKPDRNLARALSTGQWEHHSSTVFQIPVGCGWEVKLGWRLGAGINA